MRILRPFACVLAILPLASCLEFKQDMDKLVSGLTPAAEAEPAWAPAPEKIEWHPAARVRADEKSKAWVLDARIRLVDALGDYTKASGSWHFELHAVGGPAGGGQELLQRWDAEVLAFDAHKIHFDPATRAYRFTLTLDRKPPQGKTLRALVVFIPDGGDRMAAETEL